jgi:hypothetical protein
MAALSTKTGHIRGIEKNCSRSECSCSSGRLRTSHREHPLCQSLTGLIRESLGIPSRSTRLLVTLPLFGFGVSLLFFVALDDVLENRRLTLLGTTALCLLAISVVTS